MKNWTKALLLALCAVALVVASVMGTIAYLTSTDTVTNTFTVGDVAITLDEADVKTDGSYEVDANTRVKENDYHLLPGHTYTKDPTVHVEADSEPSYVFVKVVDEIAAIEDNATVAAQLATNGWVALTGEDVKNNGNVYVYTKDGSNIVAKSNSAQDLKVIDNFKIKGDVDNTTLAKYASKTIVVTAYAIQADGFDDAVAAWNASGFNAPEAQG